MSFRKNITDKERDIISALFFDAKMDATTIAEKIGCSNQTIYTQTKTEQFIKNNQIEDAQNYVKKSQLGNSLLAWALNKYGKSIPKEEPATIQTTQTEVQNIQQIDKDQMARVMFALGKIEERLDNMDKTNSYISDYIQMIYELMETVWK